MAHTSSNTYVFNWVITGVPAWGSLLGFFCYTSLILFVCFGLIPNFTYLKDVYFRAGGIVLILLIDWVLNQGRTWYKLQGKLVLHEKHLELISQTGKVEHRINYADVVRYQLHDGVQFSLFRFLSRHRTLVIELALKGGEKRMIECTKWSKESHSLSLNTLIEQRIV